MLHSVILRARNRLSRAASADTPPVKMSRLVLRLGIAAVSLVVVAIGLLAATSAIALAIDWEIPEGHELKGPALIYDRDGKLLARLTGATELRPRNLADISKHLQRAVIATEDRRFYEHQGVDPLSVVRVVVSNVRSGGIREGGSTLTQQFVKNVYVGNEQSLYRKVREALIALQLEKERSKDAILEAYLNQAYFGEGAYGAEAAAQKYFAKTAAELNAAESATLASVLSAPSALSPRNGLRAARARRDIVLDEMVRAGYLSPRQARRAQRQPLHLADPPEPNRVAPYFIEEVRSQLLAAYGDEAVYNGGLRVTTTLDVKRYERLQEQVRNNLPSDRRLDAGVAAIDPATGDVLAAYSGRSFRRSQVDLAMGRGTDGRPSGSTFKVFALAAALEDGRSLESTYPAPSSITIGGWSPGGNGGCSGSCSLLQATALSANTVYAQVANEVGAREFTDLARRLGVRQTFRDPSLPEVLGTSDVTPLDMSSAMATLANDGVACPARVITEVRQSGGGRLDPPDPRQPGAKEREAIAEHLRDLGYRFDDEDLGRCYRALAPSVARTVTKALEAVVEFGTGTRADINRPQAGKTGTAQQNQEAWFVGYTPDLAMAVAFFHRDSQKPLTGVPGCSSVCFGGELPALIWRDAAMALLKGVKPRGFKEPGEDERVYPDRRRLQAPVSLDGDGDADEEDPGEATEAPTPGPTARPSPTAQPSPEAPPPTEPPDGGGGGEEEPGDGGGDDDGDDDDDDEDDDGRILPIPDPP